MRLTTSPKGVVAALAIILAAVPLHIPEALADTETWTETDGFRTDKTIKNHLEQVGAGGSGNALWFMPGWGENDEGTSCYNIEVDQDTTDAVRDGSANPDENTSWIDSDQFIDGMTEGGVAGSLNTLLDRLGLGHIQLPEERCPGNDPDDLVEIVWRSELCPPPPPSPLNMDPDHTALTGMPGYLEIGGDNPATVTCLGEQIIATARYVINWGDGHTTETTSKGGAYPDGDVRHTYANSGDTEILVEAYWRGEWNGIDLGEIPTPTTDTLTVDVQEMQSVRTTSGG